jgi:hypothetical protein
MATIYYLHELQDVKIVNCPPLGWSDLPDEETHNG